MATTIDIPPAARTEELPFATSSVTLARGMLSDDLAALGAGPRDLGDVSIVVGELVMNAVRHGCAGEAGTVEISWLVAAGHLLFSVRDEGQVDQLVADMPAPEVVGGRGLAMVALLCERWCHDATDGTRVSADLVLTGA